MILRSTIAIVSVLVFGAAPFSACSSQGTDPGDAATSDAEAISDASVDAETTDARASSSDVSADTLGALCGFNRECASNMRCECLDGDCACSVGPRGTGKNGVTKCTSGNDCESSLCVEGSDGSSYCTDECTSEANCGNALPRCIDIALVGKICVRKPL